jgi:hypothetical protein
VDEELLDGVFVFFRLEVHAPVCHCFVHDAFAEPDGVVYGVGVRLEDGAVGVAPGPEEEWCGGEGGVPGRHASWMMLQVADGLRGGGWGAFDGAAAGDDDRGDL